MMRMEIFVGVVYYQRLRHMVSDKSQVRGAGPVHPVTQQPIKGRKRHGGIRLGEMERDALLAHGTTFILHDRLVICSDSHHAFLCQDQDRSEYDGVHSEKIAVPYIFRCIMSS
mmetsp:Transcript_30707/g.92069  ORF Transcript_30707/g.92069 Transcript_30707/m.92069 type:complete len:113 (-) Transcript_30707:7-345(-)